MMVEGCIALLALVVLAAGAFVVWMDSQYQHARRSQRIAQRFGNQDV